MAEIRSGTTGERMLRNAALTLLVAAYGVYSLYDGYIAYPVQNIKAVFTDRLGIGEPDPLPLCRNEPTAGRIHTIKPGMSLEDASRVLGGAGWEREGVSYFFGRGGFIQLRHGGHRVQEALWTPGPVHSPTDIALQIWMGWFFSAAGGLLIVRLLCILRTKAVVNDDGLILGTRPLIRFTDMTALSKGKHDEVVVLHYNDGPRSRSVSLDSYVLKEQPRIIAAICDETGLPHPNQREDAGPAAQ
ncbi:MAG: hypothetical protein ACE5E5_06875 [Phycisphaerae bacterium]